MSRWRHFYRNLVAGLFYDIPLCCNLVYSIEMLIDPQATPAIERGVNDPDNPEWVPCRIIHGGPSWKELNA